MGPVKWIPRTWIIGKRSSRITRQPSNRLFLIFQNRQNPTPDSAFSGHLNFSDILTATDKREVDSSNLSRPTRLTLLV